MSKVPFGAVYSSYCLNTSKTKEIHRGKVLLKVLLLQHTCNIYVIIYLTVALMLRTSDLWICVLLNILRDTG